MRTIRGQAITLLSRLQVLLIHWDLVWDVQHHAWGVGRYNFCVFVSDEYKTLTLMMCERSETGVPMLQNSQPALVWIETLDEPSLERFHDSLRTWFAYMDIKVCGGFPFDLSEWKTAEHI